jgi:hypothetical protein
MPLSEATMIPIREDLIEGIALEQLAAPSLRGNVGWVEPFRETRHFEAAR